MVSGVTPLCLEWSMELRLFVNLTVELGPIVRKVYGLTPLCQNCQRTYASLSKLPWDLRPFVKNVHGVTPHCQKIIGVTPLCQNETGVTPFRLTMYLWNYCRYLSFVKSIVFVFKSTITLSKKVKIDFLWSYASLSKHQWTAPPSLTYFHSFLSDWLQLYVVIAAFEFRTY